MKYILESIKQKLSLKNIVIILKIKEVKIYSVEEKISDMIILIQLYVS